MVNDVHVPFQVLNLDPVQLNVGLEVVVLGSGRGTSLLA
jgi:hypothetical protein